MANRKIFMALGAAAFLTSCGTPAEEASAVAQEETVTYEEKEDLEAELITPAESFAGGDGTEQDPWQIATKEQLALLSTAIHEKRGGYKDACYVLTADIVLNDTSDFDKWDEKAPQYGWMPIGSDVNMPGDYFEGHFDGDGHTISGMYLYAVHQADEKEDIYSCIGLFGAVSDGVVENLTVADSYIHAAGKTIYVGGIAGCSNGEEFHNCSSSAVIHAERVSYAGGILGYGSSGSAERNFPGTKLMNCRNDGEMIVGEEGHPICAGGIIGSDHGGEIIDCENHGSVICTGSITAGGVAGSIGAGKNIVTEETGSSIVQGCANFGTVETRNAGVTGSVGGLIGEAGASKGTVQITGCHNTGSVDALGGNRAGLLGWVSVSGGGELLVKDCTQEGEISVVADDNNGTCAGIAAYLLAERGNMSFDHCTNKSNVASDGDGIVGGIIASAVVQKGGNLELKDCVNEGEISAPNSTMGGIISMLLQITHEEYPESVRITGCVNHGNIRGEGFSLGGIIGHTQFTSTAQDSFEMIKCRNDGDIMVEAESDATIMVFGGLAGKLNGRELQIIITDSVNEGNIEYYSEDDNSDGKYSFAAGGLVGALSENAQVSGCSSSGRLIVKGEERPMRDDGVGIWMEEAEED